MEERILLSHGSGGRESNKLINSLFLKHFNNSCLNQKNDATMVEINSKRLAVTTDSFVITPRIFNGGDIGKLAVCGTINDLVVTGAKAKYLTCGFIIEEGFLLSELEEIVKSMANTAKEAGVYIVAGDTKVVGRGSIDGLFINTTGIGEYEEYLLSPIKAEVGDLIIVNGTLGDHGISIMCQREGINLFNNIKSDCSLLNSLVYDILEVGKESVHVIRDATRGGVAAVLNEIAVESKTTIEIDEKLIPVNKDVAAVCELLGLDPLRIANEGKIVVFVKSHKAEEILSKMKENIYGRDSKIIGRVIDNNKSIVLLKTPLGGRRILEMPFGEDLPRIC